MFKSTRVAHDIGKADFEARLPKLRTDLLEAQFDLVAAKKFPVILVVGGVEGTGVIDALTNASKVLDTRHATTYALAAATEEESERPRMWRYWRTLPPKGDMGIYAGGWYTSPLTDRILENAGEAAFEQALQTLNRFEAMLAEEGALLIKFWLTIGRKEQEKRLKKLGNDARTRWRIEESLWGGAKRYRQVERAAEQMMRVTHTDHAPWVSVNAENPYYRGLTVGLTILDAIRNRLAQADARQVVSAPVNIPVIDGRTVLTDLDLTQQLEKADYKQQLAKYQDRLNELVWKKKFRKHSLVLVFEGNDAAGKGGSIRRVTEFLDPRRYRVNQFAAPTDEEKAQPYLWRFWRRLPRRNHIGIFDRSWYGRVLVERVEGFCSEADWRRAYGEINEFEKEMDDAGVIVIKFWLSIDKDEQMRRFKAREETGYKHYKITDEDWRNREKWDDYSDAVCDMVDNTGTRVAPWTLVEANDKYFARIKVLRTICERIEKRLKVKKRKS